MSESNITKEIVRLATSAGISKDVIDLMAKKIDLLAAENGTLKTENSSLKIEVHQLRGQIGNQHPIAKPADTCPYCRRASGELIDLKPHEIFGEVGTKVGYYKCSTCGKKYDKQIRPDA